MKPQAAIPRAAIRHLGVAEEEMVCRGIVPDVDAGLGLLDRGLAHFQHRTPGIGRDIVERRQCVAGDRPAEPVFHALGEIRGRESPAAQQADIVGPSQIDDFTFGHASPEPCHPQ